MTKLTTAPVVEWIGVSAQAPDGAASDYTRTALFEDGFGKFLRPSPTPAEEFDSQFIGLPEMQS